MYDCEVRNVIAVVAVLFSCAASEVAQGQKAPAKIVLRAKNGNVKFNHAAHMKREKQQCGTCHPKLAPRSRARIKSAAACAPCHSAGGSAFQMKGNCAKCHGA